MPAKTSTAKVQIKCSKQYQQFNGNLKSNVTIPLNGHVLKTFNVQGNIFYCFCRSPFSCWYLLVVVIALIWLLIKIFVSLVVHRPHSWDVQYTITRCFKLFITWIILWTIEYFKRSCCLIDRVSIILIFEYNFNRGPWFYTRQACTELYK